MIQTLVVDDDFRVADVHAEYVARTPGFSVCGRAQTAAAALAAVDDTAPDLVLLDLYLPDGSGLELLRQVRSRPDPPDVIVITAARDVSSIRSAMQLGAVHYLVKPFTSERLRGHLTAFQALHHSVASLDEASQEDVDRLFSLLRQSPPLDQHLPKGMSEPTLALVLQRLRQADVPLSASEVAAAVGISRATAQRYLAYLLEHQQVQRHLQYGAAGRPAHRYGPV